MATFDWNRLKPTINQKVTQNLTALRHTGRSGRGLGTANQDNRLAQLDSVAPCARGGYHPRQPAGHSPVTHDAPPAGGGDARPAGIADKTVCLPWIKLEQPDVRLIRLAEENNNWTFSWQGITYVEPNADLPSAWSFRLDNILFDQGDYRHQ